MPENPAYKEMVKKAWRALEITVGDTRGFVETVEDTMLELKQLRMENAGLRAKLARRGLADDY